MTIRTPTEKPENVADSMREQGVSFTCAAPDQEGEHPAVNILSSDLRDSTIKIGNPPRARFSSQRLENST